MKLMVAGLMAVTMPACEPSPSGGDEITAEPLLAPRQPKPGGRPAGYVAVPGGGYAHSSCGQVVRDRAEIASQAACRYPVIRRDAARAARSKHGWLLHSDGSAAFNGYYDWFNYFEGSWTVPGAPREASGQLVYLFISLQPYDKNQILQPVLQWGHNGSFGGEYWVVSNWWVKPDGTWAANPPTRLYEGDRIWGWMQGDPCDSDGVCKWVVGFAGLRADGSWIPDPPKLTLAKHLHGLKAFKVASRGVLETWDNDNCNQISFAGSTGTIFSGINIWMPGPGTSDYNDVTFKQRWEPRQDLPDYTCNFGVVDPSPTSVTLRYGL